jgi:hypothetical protein
MSEQDPNVGPTYRHGDPKPFEFAVGDSENIEAIAQHIEQCIGKPATVYHEIISDKVHIDVHIVEPSETFPFYTLVTSGMSDLPMKTPEGHEDCAFAELYICLPPDWKMGQNDWKSDRYFWPIQSLKFLARFPHQYDTWLWYGHTIPNGDPPEPVNQHTRLCSFVLLGPHCVPAEFHELKINDEKTIRFFAMVPLYEEELARKLQTGAEEIEQALLAAGHSELLDPKRTSIVAEPPRGFFRRLFGR